MNNFSPELIAKAKQAKSPEELIALAEESGTELTEESAKAYFDQIHKTGELADDELDNVVAGGCGSEGTLSTSKTVTVSGRRLGWNCPVCHNDCWEESYRTTASQKWWYCRVCEKKNPSDVPYVSQPGQYSSFPYSSVTIEL